MRLTLDTGVRRDLSSKEMAMLDAKLRKAIPELVGWSYSPLTGELTLEIGGDFEDDVLLAKIEEWKTKSGCARKLRLELLGAVVEWEE